MLLAVCAVFLGGCAGSSGSASRGGPGDPVYSSSGEVVGSNSLPAAATGFAPTPSAAQLAAASQTADKLTAVAKPGSAAYRIGPLDVLDVSVFKVPDLTKSVQVADDGTINYPLVGDIPASGKTAKELEHDLKQKLGSKYLRDPQVTVFVKEYNSQRVTVEGPVKTTGVYAIKGRTSLVQVLAMAGGMNVDIASGDVIIFRTIDGTRSAAKFDVDAIKAGKAADPEVEPGDVVVVSTSDTKVAFQNFLKILPIATTAAVFSAM
jgi:polysaccharide biosynthesis/export protein